VQRLEGARVAAAFNALPERQRDALSARVLNGHDYDVIARVSGVSGATIRKRVSRALHTLRHTVGGER